MFRWYFITSYRRESSARHLNSSDKRSRGRWRAFRTWTPILLSAQPTLGRRTVMALEQFQYAFHRATVVPTACHLLESGMVILTDSGGIQQEPLDGLSAQSAPTSRGPSGKPRCLSTKQC